MVSLRFEMLAPRSLTVVAAAAAAVVAAASWCSFMFALLLLRFDDQFERCLPGLISIDFWIRKFSIFTSSSTGFDTFMLLKYSSLYESILPFIGFSFIGSGLDDLNRFILEKRKRKKRYIFIFKQS